MSWHKGTLVAFDLETTGVDIATDRIVTASRWLINSTTGEKQHAGWLVNPGVDIPEGATAVHGITTEHAREHGQDASSAILEIAQDLLRRSNEGGVVVAFNAAYDISLLHRECLRYGHTQEAQQLEHLRPIIDPLVLDKGVDTYRRGSRKLLNVAAHYGIKLTEDDAHSSSADSLAAARVAYVLATQYPHIGSMDPDALHDLQREWKAEQAASLQEYFRRTNPTAVVSPHWPLQPVPTQTQEQT